MQEDICAICLEKTTNDSYKSCCCRNKFHFECLDKWFKIKNTCPLCRKEYSHMEDYNNDLGDHLEMINNLDVKNIINNLSENVTLYKYQFEELNLKNLENILKKTESFLSILQDYYNQ